MPKAITLEDVLRVVNRVEDKLDGELQTLRKEVGYNTTFRNQLVGKMTAIFAIMGVGINLAWDFFVNRK